MCCGLNWGYWLTQVFLYNGRKMVVVVRRCINLYKMSFMSCIVFLQVNVLLR